MRYIIWLLHVRIPGHAQTECHKYIGPSSKQEWSWLQFRTNMSVPTHTGTSNTRRYIHISGCPDLGTVFSHAWNHMKEMVYDWQVAMRWTTSTSSSYTEYVTQHFSVIDTVAEQSRLRVNNDCSHTEHPSQNELLECDNYFMDTMKCRTYVHFEHSFCCNNNVHTFTFTVQTNASH